MRDQPQCVEESMTVQKTTPERGPWNVGMGLPQVFRLGDIVRVRQDGGAPPEWCYDWAIVRLKIVGTLIDERQPGRVRYFVHAEDSKWREHDPMAEDWLEAVP